MSKSSLLQERSKIRLLMDLGNCLSICGRWAVGFLVYVLRYVPWFSIRVIFSCVKVKRYVQIVYNFLVRVDRYFHSRLCKDFPELFFFSLSAVRGPYCGMQREHCPYIGRALIIVKFLVQVATNIKAYQIASMPMVYNGIAVECNLKYMQPVSVKCKKFKLRITILMWTRVTLSLP